MTLLFAVLVIALGAAVCKGHAGDIAWLTQIRNEWVDMKIETAIAFILSGVTLLSMGAGFRFAPERWPLILKTTGVALLLSLQGWVLMHQLASPGRESVDLTASHGFGSNATTIGFILFGIGVLAYGRGRLRIACAAVAAAIGGIAVLGYCIDQPAIYFYMPGGSTAMALHTGIGFILLGLGLGTTWFNWRRHPSSDTHPG